MTNQQSQPMTTTMRQAIANYLSEREPDHDGDIPVIFTSMQRNELVDTLNNYDALRSKVEELKAALRPFAAFADPRNKIPPDTILTAGSAMARKQITMADCYAASLALNSQDRGSK